MDMPSGALLVLLRSKFIFTTKYVFILILKVFFHLFDFFHFFYFFHFFQTMVYSSPTQVLIYVDGRWRPDGISYDHRSGTWIRQNEVAQSMPDGWSPGKPSSHMDDHIIKVRNANGELYPSGHVFIVGCGTGGKNFNISALDGVISFCCAGHVTESSSSAGWYSVPPGCVVPGKVSAFFFIL